MTNENIYTQLDQLSEVADNLDRENQRLQQQVDRLSKLYAFVCEENKELLEELNADKPLEQSEL